MAAVVGIRVEIDGRAALDLGGGETHQIGQVSIGVEDLSVAQAADDVGYGGRLDETGQLLFRFALPAMQASELHRLMGS